MLAEGSLDMRTGHVTVQAAEEAAQYLSADDRNRLLTAAAKRFCQVPRFESEK